MKRKQILQKLFSVFKKQEVDFVIVYGNKKGRDVDLFVGLKRDFQFETVQIGELDVVSFGGIWIPHLIVRLDPMITEPLQTGKVIFGDISELKSKLLKVRIDEEVCCYLIHTALIFFDWAKQLLKERKLDGVIWNLSFVVSYVAFAKYYKNSKKLVKFADLCSSGGICEDVTYLREMAKNMALVGEGEIRQNLRKICRMLTNVRFKI